MRILLVQDRSFNEERLEVPLNDNDHKVQERQEVGNAEGI